MQTGLSALLIRDAEDAKFDVVLNWWKKAKTDSLFVSTEKTKGC